MTNLYDYSTADRSSFDLVPAKTQAPAIFAVRAGDQGTPENAFSVTRSGLYQLTLEATITEGEYAKRKIFHRITVGAAPGTQLTEGQEKGINIGKQFLRSLLEAGRGFAPTDESPQAIEARKMSSIFELDGLEAWIEVGIEVDKTGQYGDKNTIRRILPAKASERAAGAPASAPVAAPRTPARSAAPAAPAKRGW
ncbi:MAG: hypothetical protein EBR82_08130 [Caulobacteraceae bacterium]|nr:hypothetical protein [Caulobacteraceae bacterium]